jgi:hypothetical protein
VGTEILQTSWTSFLTTFTWKTKVQILPSEGEKWILRAYIMLAVIGGVFGFFLLYDKFVEAAEVPVYRAWLAIGGAVSLSSAVFLTREGFGHRGIFLGSMRLCLASLPCFWLV